jgi:nucleotide-binding universal stress UspA family protein
MVVTYETGPEQNRTTTGIASEESTPASTITTHSSVTSGVDIPHYEKILIPHDGSEMSDKALGHAIYICKISGAKQVILNVLEKIQDVEDTGISVTTKADSIQRNIVDSKQSKDDFEIRLRGEGKRIIEDRLRICKEKGVEGQVSYEIRSGNPAEEITRLSEEIDFGLIIMASRRISSSVRFLGSTTKKVLDSIRKPTLIIRE